MFQIIFLFVRRVSLKSWPRISPVFIKRNGFAFEPLSSSSSSWTLVNVYNGTNLIDKNLPIERERESLLQKVFAYNMQFGRDGR